MKNSLIVILLILCRLYAAARPVCTVTKYDEDAGMSQWHVTQMLQDEKGMMWFSTWNGLDRFDGYKFVNFKPRAGEGSEMLSDRIRDIRAVSRGNIYCKADNGWFCFNTATGKFTKAAIPPEWKKIPGHGRMVTGVTGRNFTVADRYNTRWTICTNGKLLFNDGSYRGEYPLDNPLPPVKFYMKDRQGNLWLLTLQGVFKLTFSRNPSTAVNQEKPAATGCLYLDGNNRYWITTKADATVRLFDKDNRLAGYLTPDGRLTKRHTSFTAPVYCMLQTDSRTFFLGSKPGGIFMLREKADGSGFIVKHITNIPCKDVYNLKEDAQRRIWIATMGGGICCMPRPDDPSTIISITGKKGYPHMEENKIRFIHITRDNILLAATTEGLLVGRIPPKGNGGDIHLRLHRKNPCRASSLSCNATMDILEDSRHRLFISTESGGVCRIMTRNLQADSLEFRHYNMQGGMASDVALSLKEVDGRLLVVGSNRLMTLDTNSGESDTFGANFFGRTCRFSESRPLILPDGHLLIGLQDGVFTIPQNMMRKSSYCPPIAITGIDKKGEGVNHAVNNISSIILKPGERTITIYFAALDYAEPSAVTYAFKIGDAKQWNYTGHNRSASFIDMKPGTYILKIRSTNSDGVWVDNIRTLTIIVKPAFFESLPGKILLFVLIITITCAATFTAVHIRRVISRQRETLALYLKQINEMKDGANNIADTGKTVTGKTGCTPAPPTCTETNAKRLSPENDRFMSDVMKYIEANISNSDANINDMAQAVATSRSGLNRKMKSIVGLTPADFMREARIKYACRMLETSNLNISDIAYRCGFTDPKYFGKCFKASTGVSPSEYRNK